MEMLCRFGPVTVLFQDFIKNPVWPFWTWKLDAFKIDGGTPDLTVNYACRNIVPEHKPLFETVDANVCRAVYRLADGTLLWQQTDAETNAVQLQFLVSEDFSKITLTQDNSNTIGMGAFESLTFLIYYAFLYKNILTFHGVLLETNGKGILICAGSGVGKTTHARLWRDNKNALILNGDRSACYQKQGKWFGFGTPWCGTSGEYLNRSVPLTAVVLLERGAQNRVSPINSISLLSHTVYPSWDKASTETMLSLLDGFLKTVPVLRFECTPDASSVEVLNKALENLPL